MFQARTLLSAHRIQPKSNRSITVTGVVLHSLLIMYIITAHVSVSKVNAKKLTMSNDDNRHWHDATFKSRYSIYMSIRKVSSIAVFGWPILVRMTNEMNKISGKMAQFFGLAICFCCYFYFNQQLNYLKPNV